MGIDLEIADATCRRGGTLLFDRLSVVLATGELLAISGPNGAGKTSLLRMVAGFLPAAAGAIRLHLDGKAIDEAEERGKHVGWLGCADAVETQVPVYAQLAAFGRIHARPSEGVAPILKRCGLWRQRNLPGGRLSAGQKRRLALARLMIVDRPLWLLDEPLSLLDDEGRDLVRTALRSHCAAGGIAIAAGQDDLALPGRHLLLGGAACAQ